MDYMQLIGSIGFPIVMCLLLYNQQNEMMAQHSEEMADLREAIENNTLVVQRLLDKEDERCS